jgi:hypothetical protein
VSETPGVAPALLRYIDDYVNETNLPSALDEDLDSGSTLIVFCRELFAQLFANVIGEPITGIGGVSAQRANVLRRTKGRTWPPSLKRLVGDFQHFCKIHGDLLGEGYSGGGEATNEFHFDFVPSVLSDLHRWASDAGLSDLADTVAATRGRYDLFLSDLEPHDP